MYFIIKQNIKKFNDLKIRKDVSFMKKVILSVVSIVLCVAIVIGGFLLSKNRQTEEIPEIDFPTESIVETTENATEEVTEKVTEKTTETATEKVTEKVTVKTTEKEETAAQEKVRPDAYENDYEIIYNENGQISQFKIYVSGKFDSTKINKGETMGISVSTDYVELGKEEGGRKYMSSVVEGSTWYLDLSTKQGINESYIGVYTEYEDGETSLGDGCPGRKDPYDNAVALDFKDDGVAITVTLDEPVDVKGKNVYVHIYLAEGALAAEDGYPNNQWEIYYEKNVSQPKADFIPDIVEVVPEDEEIIPIACV
jgi:hypothetical protein